VQTDAYATQTPAAASQRCAVACYFPACPHPEGVLPRGHRGRPLGSTPFVHSLFTLCCSPFGPVRLLVWTLFEAWAPELLNSGERQGGALRAPRSWIERDQSSNLVPTFGQCSSCAFGRFWPLPKRALTIRGANLKVTGSRAFLAFESRPMSSLVGRNQSMLFVCGWLLYWCSGANRAAVRSAWLGAFEPEVRSCRLLAHSQCMLSVEHGQHPRASEWENLAPFRLSRHVAWCGGGPCQASSSPVAPQQSDSPGGWRVTLTASDTAFRHAPLSEPPCVVAQATGARHGIVQGLPQR